jgi:hypothetical protein
MAIACGCTRTAMVKRRSCHVVELYSATIFLSLA